MLKRVFAFLLTGCLSLFIVSCNTASPEKYFGLAVLTSNTLVGFANEGLIRELDFATVQMIDGDKDKSAPMKRIEIINSKIEYLEPNLGKIKQLKETDDAKDILQASLALNEYVLPVYKNEYIQLAKLYDNGTSKEQVESYANAIHDKYFAGFTERYDKLIAAGKIYAKKHNINVNWGD